MLRINSDVQGKYVMMYDKRGVTEVYLTSSYENSVVDRFYQNYKW